MASASAADEALVLRVIHRDTAALEELYTRYVRPVYSLAYRILGDPLASQDVSQEVFLKLWRQPTSYNPMRGALGPWLLSVAHNQAIDWLRRRQSHREQALPDAQYIEVFPDGAADPSDLAALSEASAVVRRALEQIPPEQRRAIEMAFFEGKTHVEISRELDEPLGTAKTRIRLGMRKLHALLEKEGVVELSP